MVSGTLLLVSNGTTASSVVRALGRLSDVFTGNCNMSMIVSIVSGRFLLVSNGNGNKSLMRCFRIWSIAAADEFAPNNIGNSAAMVSGTLLLVSNGNTASSVVRALGRLSDVFTGNCNMSMIVSIVSGRLLLVSNGTGNKPLMRCFSIWSIAAADEF